MLKAINDPKCACHVLNWEHIQHSPPPPTTRIPSWFLDPIQVLCLTREALKWPGPEFFTDCLSLNDTPSIVWYLSSIRGPVVVLSTTGPCSEDTTVVELTPSGIFSWRFPLLLCRFYVHRVIFESTFGA